MYNCIYIWYILFWISCPFFRCTLGLGQSRKALRLYDVVKLSIYLYTCTILHCTKIVYTNRIISLCLNGYRLFFMYYYFSYFFIESVWKSKNIPIASGSLYVWLSIILSHLKISKETFLWSKHIRKTWCQTDA